MIQSPVAWGGEGEYITKEISFYFSNHLFYYFIVFNIYLMSRINSDTKKLVYI